MGQLQESAQIGSQICLTADQQHPGAGAVVQDFCLPLQGPWRGEEGQGALGQQPQALPGTTPVLPWLGRGLHPAPGV